MGYQSYSQESTKLFEICYYPKMDINEFSDVVVYTCIAIVPIDDDSTKTMNNWFNSKEHKKYIEKSSSVVLKYSPDNVIYPIKEYIIK